MIILQNRIQLFQTHVNNSMKLNFIQFWYSVNYPKNNLSLGEEKKQKKIQATSQSDNLATACGKVPNPYTAMSIRKWEAGELWVCVGE